MRYVIVCLVMLALPQLAQAQEVEASAAEETPPSRTLESRYWDALAGSWAGTGAGTGIGMAVGALAGGLIGCLGIGECALSFYIGIFGWGNIGWLIGAGVGSTHGAGINGGLGVAVVFLGIATEGVLAAVGAGLGALIGAAANDVGSGAVLGTIVGVSLGALAVPFLTPLYAALFADANRVGETVAIEPYFDASPYGAAMGMRGTF